MPLRRSLEALPDPEYLKAMSVLLQDLRRLYAARQDTIVANLADEVVEQVQCAVTPGGEPAAIFG